MRKILIFLLSLIPLYTWALNIKDMAGREVDIPSNIQRLLPYDTKVSILMFPLASEIMVAKAKLPGSKTFQYISQEYILKSEVDIKNIEEILMANPQVIIGGTYNNSEGYEKFNALQKRTGIPVIVVDLSIDKLDETYLFLGSILCKEEKAAQLSNFIKQVCYMIDEVKKKSPTDASVYYTIGKSGLMTDPSGSRHTEVLDYLNINNVAKVPVPTGGHVNVNMEQVMVWNPEFILCAGFKGDKNAYSAITSDNRWKTIAAVKNNQVYKIPSQPFGWFDHPPSVNRIPGLIGVAQIFYKLDKATSKDLITEFYKLFYKYELTANEYNNLF